MSRLSRALFLSVVKNPKIKNLIFKCIFNGHTWDCESLANVAHMYQPKRVVYRSGQDLLMRVAKMDKNEGRVSRYVEYYNERKRRSGMR